MAGTTSRQRRFWCCALTRRHGGAQLTYGVAFKLGVLLGMFCAIVKGIWASKYAGHLGNVVLIASLLPAYGERNDVDRWQRFQHLTSSPFSCGVQGSGSQPCPFEPTWALLRGKSLSRHYGG